MVITAYILRIKWTELGSRKPCRGGRRYGQGKTLAPSLDKAKIDKCVVSFNKQAAIAPPGNH